MQYLTLFCLYVLLFSNPGFAQNNTSSNNSNKNKSIKKQVRPHPPDEFNRQALAKPMEIPNLPKYTGSLIYQSGLSYPNAINSGNCQMRYISKDSASIVYNWYKTALGSGNWQIKASRHNMIKAQDQNANICIVTVNPINKFTPGSQINIFYCPVYKPH